MASARKTYEAVMEKFEAEKEAVYERKLKYNSDPYWEHVSRRTQKSIKELKKEEKEFWDAEPVAAEAKASGFDVDGREREDEAEEGKAADEKKEEDAEK